MDKFTWHRHLPKTSAHPSNMFPQKLLTFAEFHKIYEQISTTLYRRRTNCYQKRLVKNGKNTSTAKKGIPERNRLLPTCVGEEK